jgi:hypothetical protein
MINPEGEVKTWRDMTPEERVADRLRHFPTLLARWRGGRARFWSYSVSHNLFTILIERNGIPGNLEISCSADHIVGPVSWENSDIEISHEPGVGYVIRDRAAGVQVMADIVSLTENVNTISSRA